jgi:hypothetical protein
MTVTVCEGKEGNNLGLELLAPSLAAEEGLNEGLKGKNGGRNGKDELPWGVKGKNIKIGGKSKAKKEKRAELNWGDQQDRN